MLGAAALAYTALCAIFPVTTYDGLIYLELARNIPVSGYTFLGEPHTKFLPLYPALMAGLDIVSAHALGVKTWGYIINVASGALLVPLIFLSTRRLGASPLAAALAAAVQLLLPVGLDQYRDINVMPLFTVLFVAMLWLLFADRYFMAGLVAGLAATTRYEVYLFLPLLAAVSVPRWRRAWKFLPGLVITAGTWWIRNELMYGGIIHTYYFAEARLLSDHFGAIALDALKAFGPVTLIAAAIGFARLPRRWLVCLAGFGALYFVQHGLWWWYRDRFILPLSPVLLIPAAMGADALLDLARRRTRPGPRAAALILSIALLAPVGLDAVGFFKTRAVEPFDPYRAAALSLRSEPASAALIGANFFLLKSYSGHESYPFSAIPKDMDPDRFMWEAFTRYGVRFVVWSGFTDVEARRFGFLADGRTVERTADTPKGKFVMHYVFLKKYDAPGKLVSVYRLDAERAP
jgi:4-amino-4-deoxy-L-arabinose transferase-like glycosyltransferase